MADPVPRPRDHGGVLLVVRDLADLRRAVTGVASIGTARVVAVRFQRPVDRLPTVSPRPHWELGEVAACRAPESWVALAFDTATPVRPVLLDLARAAAPSGRFGVSRPALGVRRAAPDQWPPADPGAKVAVLARLLDQAADLPPDLVVLDPEAAARAEPPEEDHPVLGRPSAVVVVEPFLTWEQWRALPPGEAERALAARGPTSLGAVDEQLVNPIGFERDPAGRVGSLGTPAAGSPKPAGGVLPLGDRLGEGDVTAARALAGVRLAWSGGRGPQDYCRRVVELASAGVPMVSDRTPDWARPLLPPDLVAALDRPVDLADRLRREEHSVLLRRAALRTFATPAWRSSLARAHGLPDVPAPRVSVLLATRRPEMVPFALRQVGRQRGVELELVLATHGFTPDQSPEEILTPGIDSLTVVTAERSVPFGEVLNRAANRAAGEVLLKMDDDDWYGPDFVADLLMARGYSGADVVGCSAEFTFLQELGLTTRQALPTEVYRPLVAGGTIMVDRGAFDAVGGFRHTVKYVDAGLLGAVRDSGGSTYRAHGLGYVLRRGATGHTWDPGVGYFLTSERAAEQWRGFHPSALLRADEVDRPRRTLGSGGDDPRNVPPSAWQRLEPARRPADCRATTVGECGDPCLPLARDDRLHPRRPRGTVLPRSPARGRGGRRRR